MGGTCSPGEIGDFKGGGGAEPPRPKLNEKFKIFNKKFKKPKLAKKISLFKLRYIVRNALRRVSIQVSGRSEQNKEMGV